MFGAVHTRIVSGDDDIALDKEKSEALRILCRVQHRKPPRHGGDGGQHLVARAGLRQEADQQPG